MFEKIRQELRQLQGTQKIIIPIEPDQDGFIDKECPDKKCLFQFKVHHEDWTALFDNNKVFCPMCRHEAKADTWFTTEQIENGQQKVRDYIAGRINNALHEDARNFNAKQPRNSFLKMSMRFTGSRSADYIFPLDAKEEMELKIQCRQCNARYAVIGSAFFCPCCAHNSAEETFDNAVKKIETKINNLELIRKSLIPVGKDAAEMTCRSLIETSLHDCVVAFQRYCEVTFARKFPQVPLRMNVFQNLDAGAAYWRQHLGRSYTDWISSAEMRDLKILFQKRHLLAHTEGMVDQKYIDSSGDQSYKVQQRIVVKENDILRCLNIIKKLIAKLKTEI